MGHNKEKFGALLKGIIGNFKSIIGSGLQPAQTGIFSARAIIPTSNDVDQYQYYCWGPASLATITVN